MNPYKSWKFREKMSTRFRENKLQKFLQNVTFLELGEFPTMENFIIDNDWCPPYVDQISFESVDPLTFEGDLKFSVPLAVMVTKNSKWRKKILGTDIKNLYLQKLHLAAFYRHAKFRDDTTMFNDI